MGFTRMHEAGSDDLATRIIDRHHRFTRIQLIINVNDNRRGEFIAGKDRIPPDRLVIPIGRMEDQAGHLAAVSGGHGAKLKTHFAIPRKVQKQHPSVFLTLGPHTIDHSRPAAQLRHLFVLN